MGDGMSGAAARLADIVADIARIAREAGREPSSVHLVAVSKTFAAEDIAPVLAAGHRLFGENRVQEAKAKWPALKARYPDARVHLIGPLQSNKAREAVELFDGLHCIDRPRIAEAIAAELTRAGKTMPLFVQVNTGEEPQKAGIAPRETAAFLDMCRQQLRLPITGLMCIPPVDDEPAVHFAFLAKLAREVGVEGLSMGMSGDYATAVQFGATHIRVGSAIFGARD